MTLVLNGTNGLSDVDGSAATPAIRGTDANTGIFFPAADTIAFSEGGAEAMRIDSSGNVGIGTSSPTDTSSFTRALDLNGTSGAAYYARTNSSVTNYTLFGNYGSDGYINNRGSGSFIVFNNGSERMRIDSSGNLLVGATSRFSGFAADNKLYVESSTGDYICHFRSTQSSPNGPAISYSTSPNGTANPFLDLRDSTTQRFAVRSNGGIANFQANNVNLSDRREKTNFAPAGEWLPKICAIPVQIFNYADQNLEEDPGLTLGVVAQDVQEVAPELVTESNWGSEDEPKQRLSIYQTDLQYALMKCIQEQQALITTLTDRISALDERLTALEAKP